MKKKEIIMVSACAAVVLLGFFLPWGVRGPRSISGAGAMYRLFDQGLLMKMGDLFRLIALIGLPLAAAGAAVLLFMKKGSSAVYALPCITLSVLVFLIADGFMVLRFPGCGLFITLLGGIAAPLLWFSRRKNSG